MTTPTNQDRLAAVTAAVVKAVPRNKGGQSGKEHHQYKHGQFNSPIYNSWCRMKRRCLNPNDISYSRYGAKGVKVCQSWMDFQAFYEDMKGSWFPGASLERINNSQGYSLKNCRWITKAEQGRNKTSVRLYWYRGKKRTIPEIAGLRGINPKTLYSRLVILGWTLERAVTVPTV